MNFSAALNELLTCRQRTENAYYCLRNLRNGMWAAKEAQQELTTQQVVEILDDALALLEKVVKGDKQA